MARSSSWGAWKTGVMHRYHAKRATRTQAATAFVSSPEPRSIGHLAKGRQLLAGNFLFRGQLIQALGTPIWDIGTDQPHIVDVVQGCVWLDDLAAVGDARARTLAQEWVWEWIARYDEGTGPGWTPELTGRRLIRWINHALFLLHRCDKEDSDTFFRSLSRQTAFLSRRWPVAVAGLPRFEALTGVIYAGVSLEGMQDHVTPAIAALAHDCDGLIDADGGIATRNPEELMEVETLLIWSRLAITDAGLDVPPALTAAIARIAPVLRSLRHADGGLARFHGGGRGLDGRLDQALAEAGVRGAAKGPLPMGFGRIVAGRTSIIVDGAPPPQGDAARNAHASTLAFELTSGRRPLIVNCGSGAAFGLDWHRAGRATASHSTLGLDGFSSSRLDDEDRLVDVPQDVICNLHLLNDGTRLEMAHDGWRSSHGVMHARTLDVTFDGRAVAGEDLVTTLRAHDEAQFDRAAGDADAQGVGFAIRFHLHPDVTTKLDVDLMSVSLSLKSGEVWLLRHDGVANLSLLPTVYLENGRLRPRSAQQVVLTGRAINYATRVRWSLTKAQGTPNALRDLGPIGDDEDRGFSNDE